MFNNLDQLSEPETIEEAKIASAMLAILFNTMEDLQGDIDKYSSQWYILDNLEGCVTREQILKFRDAFKSDYQTILNKLETLADSTDKHLEYLEKCEEEREGMEPEDQAVHRIYRMQGQV